MQCPNAHAISGGHTRPLWNFLSHYEHHASAVHTSTGALHGVNEHSVLLILCGRVCQVYCSSFFDEGHISEIAAYDSDNGCDILKLDAKQVRRFQALRR